MKTKQFLQHLKAAGATAHRNRGKGGHALVTLNGKSSTVPQHGDVDYDPDFLDDLQAARHPFEEHSKMNLIYPATTKTYPNGQIGVFFVDVPEAITAGATLGQALDHARDALVMALSGYIAQDFAHASGFGQHKTK